MENNQNANGRGMYKRMPSESGFIRLLCRRRFRAIQELLESADKGPRSEDYGRGEGSSTPRMRFRVAAGLILRSLPYIRLKIRVHEMCRTFAGPGND